jgi:ATP-dependent Zn protease
MKYLPRALINAADRVIRLEINHANVAETIRLCTSGRIPNVFKAMALPSDFDQLTAAIVRGGTAKNAVANLQKAALPSGGAKSASFVINLEDALEYGEARQWGLDLKQDIQDLKAGKIGWAEMDKGVVLHGPPGTGKTLLASSLGSACGVPVVLSSLGEMFASSAGHLGDVIKAQRAAFAKAVACSPSILFIDEINALPNVDSLSSRNADFWRPVIFDFYTLLDSALSGREGVIVVAATNRIEDINAALLRPGRLERAIFIGPPDEAGLERVFRRHLGADLLAEDIGPAVGLAIGHTGASVMEWVRAARRKARRAGRPMVLRDLESQMPPRPTWAKEDWRRAAVHEAGHVVASREIGGEKVLRVDLEGSRFGAVTVFQPDEKRFLTRDDIERKVVVLLAGRAAEIELLGAPSSGAGGNEFSDLARATKYLVDLRTSYGLDESLLWQRDPETDPITSLDHDIQNHVELDLHRLQATAGAIMVRQRAMLERIAKRLEQKGALSAADIASLAANDNARDAKVTSPLFS